MSRHQPQTRPPELSTCPHQAEHRRTIHEHGHVPVLAVTDRAAFRPSQLQPRGPRFRTEWPTPTPPASSNPPHSAAHGPAGTQAFPARCGGPGAPWRVPSLCTGRWATLGLRQLEGLTAAPSSSWAVLSQRTGSHRLGGRPVGTPRPQLRSSEGRRARPGCGRRGLWPCPGFHRSRKRPVSRGPL